MVVLQYIKAQVKMLETVAVLIVFFLLLILSFVFYMNYQKAQFRLELEQKEILKSIEIASKSFLMPELDCSVVGVKIPNCYDRFKLKAFSKLYTEDRFRTYYFNIFGLETIKVMNLYQPNEVYTIYDSKPVGKEPKKNVFRTPVCLQDPITRTCSFGIIEAITYVERE